MPFGSQLSNQTAPYVERYLYSSWSGVEIGQGTSWQPFITSMTMPFTGDIFVDLWVQLDYGGATILNAEVWPATPIGPSNFFAGKVSQWDLYSGCYPCPMFGRWANLAAGTYFDLTIQIRNNICNGTCKILGLHGFMRAQAY